MEREEEWEKKGESKFKSHFILIPFGKVKRFEIKLFNYEIHFSLCRIAHFLVLVPQTLSVRLSVRRNCSAVLFSPLCLCVTWIKMSFPCSFRPSVMNDEGTLYLRFPPNRLVPHFLFLFTSLRRFFYEFWGMGLRHDSIQLQFG